MEPFHNTSIHKLLDCLRPYLLDLLKMFMMYILISKI